MNNTRRKLCLLLSALPLYRPLAHAQGGFVSLGHVDLSFYEVTSSLIQIVLERLGHNVGVQKGSHAQIYPVLGKGGVDLFVAAWLPNAHAPYWEEHKDNVEKVTLLFDDARLFWSVPDYVPASEVRSVADLLKPEVVAKMQKEIRGTRPDSGLMIGSKKIMETYALEQAGYQLAPGNPADWIANFEANVAAQRWFVMPLWQPHYLNRVARMRILEEPRQLLGGSDNVFLLAHKDFRARIGKRTWSALQRISLSLKVVTELDYLVNVRKFTPQVAARQWAGAHPDTFQYWVQPDIEG